MTKRFFAILAACLLLGFSTEAKAVLVVDPAPLTIGDAFYMGHIVNGTPSSEAAEAAYINFLATLDPGAAAVEGPNGNDFDRLDSTLDPDSFPTATAVGAETVEVNSIDTGDAIFFYVYAKYGGDAHVWFFEDGVMGEITVPANNAGGQGLSHLALFDPGEPPPPGEIPEPASLAIWGALGMVGLVAARRRFRKK